MAEAIFAAGSAPARPAATLPPADLVGQLKPIEAALRAAALVLGGANARQPVEDAAARLLVVCSGLHAGQSAPADMLEQLEGVEEKLQDTLPLLGDGSPPWLLVDDALGRLALACDAVEAEQQAGEMLAEKAKARMSAGGGDRKSGKENVPDPIPDQGQARDHAAAKVDPGAFTDDRERLQLACDAACQVEALQAVLIAAGVDPGPSPDATLSIAIRCDELVGSILYALRPDGADIADLRQTVYGTRRAATGAAA